MSSDLHAACLATIQQSDKPMTLSEIGNATGRKVSSKKAKAELLSELGHLRDAAAIHEWPAYGRSRVFWIRPLAECLAEAFERVVASELLTVPKAAGIISKKLHRVSEKAALAALEPVTAKLLADQRILQVAPSGQDIKYLSCKFVVHRFLPQPISPPSGDASIEAMILGAVEALQSGPGNFVKVELLRNAPDFRRRFDDAAIKLAREGKLVLMRYGGPRPVPEMEKKHYVEDLSGELFIGVALPLVE
jgi:hypothetical protein